MISTNSLEILDIDPIVYRWASSSGYETNTIYAGFSAQNVQEVIPEAVGEDRRGFLTFSDRHAVSYCLTRSLSMSLSLLILASLSLS